MTAFWHFETANVTSCSRLQARLEETASDVVLFQEHRWTAPRPPEQRLRIRKTGWDVTLSPALQSDRSENASSGGTGLACRAGITAMDVRHMDVSVELPPQHRVQLQLVNAVWRVSCGQRVLYHGNPPLRAEHCVSEHAGSGLAGD